MPDARVQAQVLHMTRRFGRLKAGRRRDNIGYARQLVKSFTTAVHSRAAHIRRSTRPSTEVLRWRWAAAVICSCTLGFVLLLQATVSLASASPPASGYGYPISGSTLTPGRPTTIPTWPAPTVVGRSVEGRPLEVYSFGQGEHARMIIADIHGGYEWNTAELADQLIDFVTQHPNLVPPDVTLYILPTMNPDGLAKSHSYEGRANANGVDLNRNFPLDWKASWPPEGCWHYLPITSGTHPLSEPESQAAARFLLGHGIEALISYHSAALGIFAGGNPSTPASLSLAAELASVSPYAYPPKDTGCEYSGEMVDWAAANGIAAVDIELSTHYNLDTIINQRVIHAFLNWQP